MLKLSLALFLLLGLLAACGSPQTTPPNGKNTDTNDQITLRFSWWGGEDRHKATLQAIDLYMQKHPNVKIEPEYSGYEGYYKKVVTQLTGGTAPDIIQLDPPWLSDLASKGDLFANMNDMKGLIQLDSFDQGFLNDYSVVNQKLLGLPTGINGKVTLYNKELLSQAGITLKDQWDWNDLLSYSQKLYDFNHDFYFLNGDFQNIYYVLKAYTAQKTGGSWFNSDYTVGVSRDQLVDTFNFLLKMIDTHAIQPFELIAPYDHEAEKNPNFLNGKIAAKIDDLSEFGVLQSKLKEKAGIAGAPIFAGSKNAGVIVRPSQVIVINNKSKSKEEAAKFLDFFFNDPEAAKILGVSRGVPASIKAQDALKEAGLLPADLLRGVEIALATKGTPENQVEVNTELIDITLDMIQQVGFKKLTPEQAADQLLAKYQQKLAELKK